MNPLEQFFDLGGLFGRPLCEGLCTACDLLRATGNLFRGSCKPAYHIIQLVKDNLDRLFNPHKIANIVQVVFPGQVTFRNLCEGVRNIFYIGTQSLYRGVETVGKYANLILAVDVYLEI